MACRHPGLGRPDRVGILPRHWRAHKGTRSGMPVALVEDRSVAVCFEIGCGSAASRAQLVAAQVDLVVLLVGRELPADVSQTWYG